MRYLILFIYCFLMHWYCGGVSYAALNDVEKAQTPFQNILVNPGFENGRSTWLASDNADIAIVTSGTNLLLGKNSATYNSNGASETFQTEVITIPKGLYGKNGLAYCSVQVPSGTATHLFQVYDGSNILSQSTIESRTTPIKTPISFVFPTSGSLLIRFVTVASDEPLIAVDDCYLGENFNVGTVAQANFVGGLENAGASSCSYAESTSSGFSNFINLGTGTSCAAWTATSNGPGTISAQGTNDHRLVYTNMPAGNYIFEVQGIFQKGAATGACVFRLSDSTTTYQPQFTGLGTSTGILSTPGFRFHVSVTSTATRTYKLQAADDFADACSWVNASNQPASWKVYRFPTSSEMVYKPSVDNWLVSATISGANAALSTASEATYLGITNGSLTLTNSSLATIAARIPCSSTNPPTGTTCSVGDESVGVNFVVPRAGPVEACFSFGHAVLPAANSADNGMATTFQVVETASNAQTILTEGIEKTGSDFQIRASAGTFIQTNTRKACGYFNFTSAGEKTLRLFYEQVETGTINSNLLTSDGSASYGDRNISVIVRPISQNVPAPLLVNSVVTNSSGVFSTQYADVNCDAASSITNQSGTWISSIGNRSTTSCALTIASGVFSATPYTCNVTIKAATVNATSCSCASSTSCTIYGPNADYDAYISIAGPR